MGGRTGEELFSLSRGMEMPQRRKKGQAGLKAQKNGARGEEGVERSPQGPGDSPTVRGDRRDHPMIVTTVAAFGRRVGTPKMGMGGGGRGALASQEMRCV